MGSIENLFQDSSDNDKEYLKNLFKEKLIQNSSESNIFKETTIELSYTHTGYELEENIIDFGKKLVDFFAKNYTEKSFDFEIITKYYKGSYKFKNESHKIKNCLCYTFTEYIKVSKSTENGFGFIDFINIKVNEKNVSFYRYINNKKKLIYTKTRNSL